MDLQKAWQDVTVPKGTSVNPSRLVLFLIVKDSYTFVAWSYPINWLPLHKIYIFLKYMYGYTVPFFIYSISKQFSDPTLFFPSLDSVLADGFSIGTAENVPSQAGEPA